MRLRLKADGDSWLATRDLHDRRRAVHTIVFHCLSDTQRPYRVIEVPEDAFAENDLANLAEPELRQLFDRSHTMDYSHDRAASPRDHGYGDSPLE